MQEAAKVVLIDLVEIQMTELIREACIVQRHTKRSRFACSGNSDGSSGVPNMHRRLLDATDINLALSWRGCDRIFLTGVGAQFTSYENSSNAVVALNKYLHSEPIVTPPTECGMTLHWLAIDGVQPNTAANPVADPSSTRPASMGWSAASSLVLDGASSRMASSSSSSFPSSVKLARKLLPHVVSEELRLYFLRVTTALEANKEDCTAAAESRALRLQTSAILHHIGLDSGVQELVPFFVQFAEYQIYDSFASSSSSSSESTPRYCRLLVHLIERMLHNKYMHLELHLHQLIPPLLTCVVAHRVGSRSNNNASSSNSYYDDDEHSWLLRQEAACALANAVDIYGDQYATLKARILKTMCEAAVSNKLSTQYGGIVGLSQFGPKAVEAFLLPLSVRHWSRWESQLQNLLLSSRNNNNNNNNSDIIEILHCQQALLNALGAFISSNEVCFHMSILMEEEFSHVFGEKLSSLAVHHSEYSSYFI